MGVWSSPEIVATTGANFGASSPWTESAKAMRISSREGATFIFGAYCTLVTSIDSEEVQSHI